MTVAAPHSGDDVRHALALLLLGDDVPGSIDPYAMAGAKAAHFLASYTRGWDAAWHLNLCALVPTGDAASDGSTDARGRSWPAPLSDASVAEIAGWIADRNWERRGVYLTTNPLRCPAHRKPRSADIAAVVALHVDADPDIAAAGSYDTARAALWADVQAVKTNGALPPPSFVVDSGNGAGLFYRLPEPMGVAEGGIACRALQERAGDALPRAKVDATHNPDRLMRLPFTRNWTSKGKAERGYPQGDASPWASLRDGTGGGAPLAPEAVAGLAAEGGRHGNTDPASVPQEALRAPDAASLVALVRDMPNAADADRARWVDTLRAIRASAAGLLPDDGKAVACEWSERWEGGEHDEAAFAKAWRSLRGPSLVGWSHLLREAEKQNPDSTVVARLRVAEAAHDFADVAPEAAAGRMGAGGRLYGRLRVWTAGEIVSAPPRRYLLKPLLAHGDLSVFHGQPKTGKSFIVLRLAYGLALGQGFGPFKAPAAACILYVAAEGAGGMGARLQALRDALGDAGERFRVIAQPVTIGPPGTDLGAVTEAVRDMQRGRPGEPVLVVLDTLARTFGSGDENQQKDMQAFVSAADKLREATGAHVLIVHHNPKGSDDMRGSGALRGAADAVVLIRKGENGKPNIATVTDAKDDADGERVAFRLQSVTIGTGDEGEARMTCIAIEAEGVREAVKLTPMAKDALRCLVDAAATEGVLLPAGTADALFRPDARGVSEGQWFAACEARSISKAQRPEDRRKAYADARDKLRAASAIEEAGGLVWARDDAPGSA